MGSLRKVMTGSRDKSSDQPQQNAMQAIDHLHNLKAEHLDSYRMGTELVQEGQN